MSQTTGQVEKHGVCDQHGANDAWDCGVCGRLRVQCGLAPTESHITCGKVDLGQTIRVSKDEYEQFIEYRNARIEAQRKAGLTI